MGLLDHTKAWQFEVRAAPRECVRSFTESLSHASGMVLLGSRWSVTEDSAAHSLPRAVARYRGRAGVAGAVAAVSRRSRSEEDAAYGTELVFAVTEYDSRSGVSVCSMRMTTAAKIFIFFTADARFLRGAMHRVAAGLRTLDARLELTKG